MLIPTQVNRVEINKEEKMNFKANKMNLKINDDMYVEKNEQQKKMQTIVAEAKEQNTPGRRGNESGVRETTSQVSPRLPLEQRETLAKAGGTEPLEKEDTREQPTAPQMTRGQLRPTMPKS